MTRQGELFPLLERLHVRTRWQVFTSFVAGLVLALTFLPYAWSWLAPLPLAVLFWLVARTSNSKAAFRVGFTGGLAFFALHLLWLPVSFSALFGAVIVVPMLLLPPLLGVFWGLTTALCRLTGRYTLLALPVAWVVLEYLRAQGIFGFPWGTLGYAFLPTPLIQIADLGGVYLVSLLVALTAAGLASLAQGLRWPVWTAAALLTLSLVYGLTQPAPKVPDQNVVLVQGSVNPLDKAESRSVDELTLYLELSRAGLGTDMPVDLLVWPEGASPYTLEDPEVAGEIAALGVPAIIGAPSFNPNYQNTAFGFDGEVTSSYSKIKLVPFGESFPLRQPLSFIYDPLFNAIGLPGLVGTTPGESYEPLSVNGIVAGTYICYESVFPQVARTMVQRGANLLVNISNDAWFGTTAGAEQHFQMGRVRAIETRRYLARAGNDGISAVIDPLGRVTARFPRGQRAAFFGRVALQDDLTVYVRFGDWVVWLSGLGLAALLLVAWRTPAPKGGRDG
jgi:apolipoprotein N-acyltransferase